MSEVLFKTEATLVSVVTQAGYVRWKLASGVLEEVAAKVEGEKSNLLLGLKFILPHTLLK